MYVCSWTQCTMPSSRESTFFSGIEQSTIMIHTCMYCICTYMYTIQYDYVCVHVDKYSVFWRAISWLPVFQKCAECDTCVYRIYMMTEPSRDSPYGTPCSPELNTLWHICTRIYILYVCVHVDKYSVFWRAVSGLPVLRSCTEYDTYIHVYIYHMYSCMWINTLYFEEPSRDSLFSGIVQSVTQMCMYICHVYVQ